MPGTTYAATKAALISLVRTISGELISRHPGECGQPRPDCDAALWQASAISSKRLPLPSRQGPAGRFENPRRLPRCRISALDEAAFTVGSELLIDGGWHLSQPHPAAFVSQIALSGSWGGGTWQIASFSGHPGIPC